MKINPSNEVKLALAASLWFIAVTVPRTATGQEAPTPDYRVLSGRWEGQFGLQQRGDCSIGKSGVAYYPVRIKLDVATDGSFTAEVGSPRSQVTRSWTGKFDKGLNFSASGTGRAVCRGEQREYRIVFSGKANQEKGRFRLKVEGLDEGCPDQKCRFLQVYDLKQK